MPACTRRTRRGWSRSPSRTRRSRRAPSFTRSPMAGRTTRPRALARAAALARLGERRVAIPFAQALADLVPPKAVRLRRDFGLLLTLIRAHALLHRASRESRHGRRDRRHAGRLRGGARAGRTADRRRGGGDGPRAIRETVAAVERLCPERGGHGLRCGHRRELDLDKSAASRRASGREGARLPRQPRDEKRPAGQVRARGTAAGGHADPAGPLQCCGVAGGERCLPLPVGRRRSSQPRLHCRTKRGFRARASPMRQAQDLCRARPLCRSPGDRGMPASSTNRGNTRGIKAEKSVEGQPPIAPPRTCGGARHATGPGEENACLRPRACP